VPNRIPLIYLLVFCGLWSVSEPALGQALVPHTLQLDSTQLEQQGLSLAQEAAQLAQFQQYELALPRARLATELAPKTYQSWFLLGGLYLQTNKFDQALLALQRARSLAPRNASILFALGSANFQQEKYNAAVENLQAGLKLKPNDSEGLFDLGNAYYKLGRLPDAIAQYDKAIALNQKFWPAINNIGLLKYEQGDVQAALKQWQTASAIEKQAAEPRLAMAVALYAKGNRQQGIAIAQEALRLDPHYGDLDFLKQNLWGPRLLTDTKKLLETPRIQASLQVRQDQPAQLQMMPSH
jgi:tetratricopeptide (TPR) repeat protein